MSITQTFIVINKSMEGKIERGVLRKYPEVEWKLRLMLNLLRDLSKATALSRKVNYNFYHNKNLHELNDSIAV